MSWGAIVGAVGGLGGGALDYFSQQETNRANNRIAREQMHFQEQMSNSAYQRSFDDMRAAGINPILAMQGSGGPASTPSGASIAMQNPEPGKAFSQGVNSAMQGARLDADLANLREQNKQISSQAELNDALKVKAAADAVKTGVDTKLSIANTGLANSNAKNVATNTERAAADLVRAKNKSEVEKTRFGKTMSYVDRFFESFKGGADATSAASKSRATAY